MFTVAELAEALGGVVEGDEARVLTGVAGLEEAGEHEVSFVSNRRYVRKLAATGAGAVLVDRQLDGQGKTLIRVADPYAAFARALALFHPEQRPEPGVHPRAFVAEGAEVEGATIEAFAVVESGARVGAGAWVQSHAYVGRNAVIGRDVRLMPGSVVCDGCAVGDRSWLNPGAVVGSEGFGFAPTAAGNLKIPQVGTAVVEADVELGAQTCVDRAALGTTVVRRGAKLDNLVQIGHAAEVGEHSLMVAYSGVAGSSKLGARSVLGAKAAVLGHIELGEGVQVGVSSVVRDSQPDRARVTGVPAIPHRRWLRAATVFGDLPEHDKRIRALEARLARLEGLLAARTPVPGDNVAESPEAPSDGTEAATELLSLPIDQIMKYLPHRLPFLMIDRVLEVERGVRAVGIKCVAANEPWFAGHFPGMPVFPGVLVAEAFAQLAGVVALTANPDYAGQDVYLMGVDRLRLRKPITPGDVIRLTATKSFERRRIWKFTCLAEVDGVRVADAEIMATVMPREG